MLPRRGASACPRIMTKAGRRSDQPFTPGKTIGFFGYFDEPKVPPTRYGRGTQGTPGDTARRRTASSSTLQVIQAAPGARAPKELPHNQRGRATASGGQRTTRTGWRAAPAGLGGKKGGAVTLRRPPTGHPNGSAYQRPGTAGGGRTASKPPEVKKL